MKLQPLCPPLALFPPTGHPPTLPTDPDIGQDISDIIAIVAMFVMKDLQGQKRKCLQGCAGKEKGQKGEFADEVRMTSRQRGSHEETHWNL